jgi:hypothetical protein
MLILRTTNAFYSSFFVSDLINHTGNNTTMQLAKSLYDPFM